MRLSGKLFFVLVTGVFVHLMKEINWLTILSDLLF